MTILPAVTEPWDSKIERRHTPRPATRKGGFEDYRSCLRWEFDFYCAFCLCHEADLRPKPAEGTKGTGLFSIEHFVLRKEDPTLANVYENCFHACRFCNRDRGGKSHLGVGERLLNPCDDVWGDHFVRDGDRLRPRGGDPDARYTHAAYNLDSVQKRRARRLRKEQILAYDKVRTEYPSLIAGVRRKAIAQGDPELIQFAKELREIRLKTIRDTKTYLLRVPRDTDRPCACKVEPPASPRVHLAEG